MVGEGRHHLSYPAASGGDNASAFARRTVRALYGSLPSVDAEKQACSKGGFQWTWLGQAPFA